MYAVIKSGGKQYRVEAGAQLKLEKLTQEVGEKVTFDEVLMVGDGDKIEIGRPTLEGRTVTALVLTQGRGRKVKIVKFRRRKHYLKQGTHRQSFTAVRIEAIN